ncbi:HpcH/HpaI aldolase family protein [Fontivita pretiosa]|uniref:HpcH/HpaI aldolase family protein n=1 Tax=Fontivita pretiosa TaxID=2989684 RepID=UPI003D17D388
MSELNNLDKFLAKIGAGGVCLGCGIWFRDPTVSEVVAEAGFDFTWIDMEHGPLSIESALGHVMAVRGTDTAPFVRVPWNDPVMLKPVLELAPAAVIVPMICSAQEAARAVSACKYPPAGTRGFGPVRGMRYGATDLNEYLRRADRQALIMLQIEHVDALSCAQAIIDTPGVDGICVGPYDLSASMGRLGRIDDSELCGQIERVLGSARAAGKLAGIACGSDPAAIARWRAAGAQWLAIGADVSSLFAHSQQLLAAVRPLLNC